MPLEHGANSEQIVRAYRLPKGFLIRVIEPLLQPVTSPTTHIHRAEHLADVPLTKPALAGKLRLTDSSVAHGAPYFVSEPIHLHIFA